MNVQELFKRLPIEIKSAMYSAETSEAIEKIAEKYHLLIDKMGILAEETGLVMLGATHPKDFIRNLSDKLGVDRETSKKIADDVNQQIFSKVRGSLRKLHGITDEKEAAAPAAEKPPAEIGKPKPLEIKPAPALSWPASPIGPGPEKDAGLKFVPRVDGIQKPQPPEAASPPPSSRLSGTTQGAALPQKSAAPLDLPVAPAIKPDQIGESGQSSEAYLAKMKEQETAGPSVPQKPIESPHSTPPAAPVFKEKLEEKVFVEPPELRKIERPTADPYREPLE